MKHLRNCVAPVQFMAVILIPFIITLIIISVFAAGLSILDYCTFREATHSIPMCIIAVGLFIGGIIATASMVIED